MADSSDMAIALSATLNRMLKEHSLPLIPIIMSDQKCYVCGKQGCWSTTHTDEERAAAYNRFRSTGRGPRDHSKRRLLELYG